MDDSRSSQRIPFRVALRASISLSLLFVIVYGGASWLTSLRSDVSTWHYAWERHIPFVPIMVIPYMSIDLFFVAAPFLCRDGTELGLFSRRIALAVIAAGLCFVLFPLQLAVERPVADGWLGSIYNGFCAMDRPYNLCPSLHITLRTLLAAIYAHHTRGLLRAGVHLWFVLIGLSTLLVYQHHVVDVAGGFLLALFCFYLVERTPLRLPATPNLRVGFYYALASVACLAMSPFGRPWSIVLIWPATACALVATGYFWFGPGIFRKHSGTLPLSARILLWPVLLGQRASLQHYRRQCSAWDAFTPEVWIGRTLSESEAVEAVESGVTATLDLSVAFAEAKAFLNGTNYHHIPVLDLTAPTQRQLREAAEFIEAQSKQGTVYVHCKIGFSRSAAALGAWLLTTRRVSDVDAAIAQLRATRPSIVIRPEIHAALKAYASNLDEPNRAPLEDHRDPPAPG